MQRRHFISLGLAMISLVSIGYAADKADPTGTWKWKVNFNNQDREVTLKLKYESDKLTGKISGQNNTEIDIADATFKDSEIAFNVTRERDGQKRTMKYKGKLDGDTIKGKAEFERDGQAQSRDWEAKREKS